MNKKNKYISLVLTAALCITACTNRKKQVSDSLQTNDITLQTQGIHFDTISFHTQEDLIAGLDTPYFDIRIVMPFAQGECQLARTINRTICQEFLQGDNKSPRQAIQFYADSLAKEYREDLAEYFEPGEKLPFTEYTWYVSGDVSRNPRPGCIAYSLYVETYLGGPHGSHDIYYLNIDSQTGHRISKADVFRADKENDLLKAIIQHLVKDNGCRDHEELMEKTGITSLGEVFVEKNFLLEAEGITFLYNTYEIASYAEGTISVFLSYEELKDFLNEGISKN